MQVDLGSEISKVLNRVIGKTAFTEQLTFHNAEMLFINHRTDLFLMSQSTEAIHRNLTKMKRISALVSRTLMGLI